MYNMSSGQGMAGILFLFYLKKICKIKNRKEDLLWLLVI
jgi:hypothetical protein